MASFRSQIVRLISGYYMKRVRPDRDVHVMRAGLERRAGFLPPARGVEVRPTIIDGLQCEMHIPSGCAEAPMIYYLHGGAYMMGSPASHRRLVSHIARQSGMRALLPDYRLAPENRYPTALQDSLGVYRELLKGGMDPGTMAIGGDSAGGNLAVATLLALRDAGDALPAACFLLSPWLDMTGTGETMTTRADRDPWFRPAYVSAVAGKFCDESQRTDPLVSPVFADVSGLPSTLIQVGDDEILLSDAVRFAENITHSGGEVALQIWPQMWHVFQFFVGQMPESDRAISDIARFLETEFDSGIGSNRADDRHEKQ